MGKRAYDTGGKRMKKKKKETEGEQVRKKIYWKCNSMDKILEPRIK